MNYPITLDEIDQWLFDSFGILPGACSSTENLRHTTARMVAEALWPKRKKKMIEELEKPYKDACSGLVLDIPELVEKINEIIRYINEKEEENESSY